MVIKHWHKLPIEIVHLSLWRHLKPNLTWS